MLGKLLKYEFKSTGRMFGVIYLVILILSLMIGLLGRRYLTMSVAIWNHDGIRLAALAILIVAYFVMLVAMVVVTFVVILQRFLQESAGRGRISDAYASGTYLDAGGQQADRRSDLGYFRVCDHYTVPGGHHFYGRRFYRCHAGDFLPDSQNLLWDF